MVFKFRRAEVERLGKGNEPVKLGMNLPGPIVAGSILDLKF